MILNRTSLGKNCTGGIPDCYTGSCFMWQNNWILLFHLEK